MSIESFFHDYPADTNFARDIDYLTPKDEKKSPVRFMSEVLIKEGREGLMEVGFPFLDSIHGQDFKEAERYRGRYINNSAAIYLGVGIQAIEDMFHDGKLNADVFNSRLGLAFAGTYLEPVAMAKEGAEKVDPNRLKTITRIAQEDKTFVSFFESSFPVLPETMVNFYNHQDMYLTTAIITNIRRFILPRYENRTVVLIDANRQKVA